MNTLPPLLLLLLLLNWTPFLLSSEQEEKGSLITETLIGQHWLHTHRVPENICKVSPSIRLLTSTTNNRKTTLQLTTTTAATAAANNTENGQVKYQVGKERRRRRGRTHTQTQRPIWPWFKSIVQSLLFTSQPIERPTAKLSGREEGGWWLESEAGISAGASFPLLLLTVPTNTFHLRQKQCDRRGNECWSTGGGGGRTKWTNKLNNKWRMFTLVSVRWARPVWLPFVEKARWQEELKQGKKVGKWEKH